MDIERVHSVAVALVDELTPIVQRLGGIANSNDPDSLDNSLPDVIALAASSPSNQFPPTWYRIVAWMGGADLSGVGLAHRLEFARQGREVTGAARFAYLSEIYKEVGAFRNTLEHLTQVLSRLQIPATTLKIGEVEIGVRYPAEFGIDTLEVLGDEVEELSRHIRTFAEIATGQPPAEPKLRALGTGSPEVLLFLETDPITAAAIILAIERATKLIKTLLEIAKLWKDLEDKAYGKGAADALKQQENQVESAETESIVSDLLGRYGGAEGRKNELRGLQRRAIQYLLDRARRGVQFEVSTGPPPPEGSPEVPAWAELRLIKEKGNAMRALYAPRRAVAELVSDGEEARVWSSHASAELTLLREAVSAGDIKRAKAQLDQLRRLHRMRPEDIATGRILAGGLAAFLEKHPSEELEAELRGLADVFPGDQEIMKASEEGQNPTEE